MADNLISRYVEVVKRELPAGRRQEVGSHLTEVLEQKIAAARKERGALQEADIAALLLAHGHPYRVAMSYRARRALVNEAAYPLYKRALSFVLVTYLTVTAGIALFEIAEFSGAWAVVLIPSLLGTFISVLLFAFFIVTVVFHFLGEHLSNQPFFWRWDPVKLPPAEQRWTEISVTGTCLGIITMVFCLALLTAERYQYSGQFVTFGLDADVIKFVVPLRAVAAIVLVVNVINLFQPHWTRAKLGIVSLLGVVATVCLVGVAVNLFPVNITFAIPSDVVARAPSSWWLEQWPDLTLYALLLFATFKIGYRSFVNLYRAVKRPAPLL